MAIISMIVAVAQNRVIGRNNQLPWNLPGDLPYFRNKTWGKPIIMGRKTYESLGRPLPGRTNIVITRNSDYAVPEGVRLVNSVDRAIDVAQAVASIDAADEIMIIGGAEIYSLCLPVTQKLYLTEVHADVHGDAYFPEFNKAQWKEISRTAGENDPSVNPYEFSFAVYERIQNS